MQGLLLFCQTLQAWEILHASASIKLFLFVLNLRKYVIDLNEITSPANLILYFLSSKLYVSIHLLLVTNFYSALQAVINSSKRGN